MKHRNSEILTLLKYDTLTGVNNLFDKPYCELFISSLESYKYIYQALYSENKEMVEERSIESLTYYFSINGLIPLENIRPCFNQYSANRYINYIVVLRDFSPLFAKIIYNKAADLYKTEQMM